MRADNGSVLCLSIRVAQTGSHVFNSQPLPAFSFHLFHLITPNIIMHVSCLLFSFFSEWNDLADACSLQGQH